MFPLVADVSDLVQCRGNPNSSQTGTRSCPVGGPLFKMDFIGSTCVRTVLYTESVSS